jgi:hypothetical protein
MLVPGLEDAVLRAAGGEAALAVQRYGEALAASARAAAPVGAPRPGQPHLREQIAWVPTGAARGELRLPVRALYTDSGTRPHVIRARTPAGLHFYSARQGRWVRTRQVRHPGYAGTHWFRRAIPAAAGAVDDPVLAAALVALAQQAATAAGFL